MMKMWSQEEVQVEFFGGKERRKTMRPANLELGLN